MDRPDLDTLVAIDGYGTVARRVWNMLKVGQGRYLNEFRLLLDMAYRQETGALKEDFDITWMIQYDIEILQSFTLNPIAADILELFTSSQGKNAYPWLDLRCLAAEQPQCPWLELIAVAEDRKLVDPENLDLWQRTRSPRAGVAGNPSSPLLLLKDMAEDEDWAIRWRVAGNTSCPQRSRNLLENDPVEAVRDAWKAFKEDPFPGMPPWEEKPQ